MRTCQALPLLILVGAVWCGVCWGQKKKSPRSPSASDETTEARRLINQLGSDRFRDREEATRKLKALGEKALPELETALRSSDPEVRRRAEAVAAFLREEKRQRILRKLLAEAASLPIDQMIDRLATRNELDKPESWERFHQLAQAMTLRASQLGGKEWTLPKLDYKTFATVSDGPGVGTWNQKIRVDGIGNRVTSISRCLVVSGGPIERFTGLIQSILFVNGDLKGCTSISDCFVFCNGNIGRITGIRNSIILATGDFQGSTVADNSFFQVKSVGRHTNSQHNVYLNLQSVRCTTSENNVFPQNKKGPLQIVNFFDPASLGIEFSQIGERIRIDKVCEGKAFARFSLRPGDIVLKADKNEMASAEFRKFLRCRLPSDQFTLTVRRGQKTVVVKVQLKN